MKEERRQYQEEIRQERGELDQLKAEKRALEADITKLRMNKEQLTRKLRWVQTHICGERYLYKQRYMHWVNFLGAHYCKHITFGDVIFLAPLAVASLCEIKYIAKCAFIKV